MKKILFLYTIVFSLEGICQHSPLADSCMMWNYYVYYPFGNYQYSEFYVLKPYDDTLISTFTYHKIYIGIPNYYSYCGGVREIGGKALFIERDSVNEYLLFDLNVNDTLRNLFCYSTDIFSVRILYDAIIYEVDSVLLATGQYLKQIKYYPFRARDLSSTIWYSTPYIISNWTEKLGSGNGLLLNPNFTSISGEGAYYCCYCTSDAQITSFGNFDYCDTICDNSQNLVYSLGLNNRLKNNTLIVFPNPASTKLTINSSNEITSARIYDITGRILTQFSIKSNSSTINVSQFNSGTYFLEIVTEKGKGVEKFVKE